MSDPSTGITTTPTPPESQPLPGGTTPRSALGIVFLVVFIDLLGFGLVLPLLPRYAEDYVLPLLGIGKGGNDWRVGPIIGALMASFSLMQFVFAPIWGRISDRVGRRPILLLGLAGSVVFYALFGFASGFSPEAAGLALTLIFVSRIGAGIAGATIATAQAVIADCTPPEKRKHGMALIGAAFGIGFTVGPLVGYLSLQTGRNEAIGYAAAVLSLLALILGIVLLPETRRFGSTPPVRRGWLNWSATREVLSSAALGPVVLVFFLATLGFGGFESTLSVLIEDALGLAKDNTLLVFAFVGLVLLLTQGFLYRKLAGRLSEVTFMTLGLIFMGLGLLCLGGVTWVATQTQWLEFSGLLTTMLVSLGLAVVGFAFLTPSVQALISRRTDTERQGEILGVNQSASALARILGPLVGLALFYANPTRLLPYAFGAALLLCMLPLIPRIRRGGEDDGE